MRFFHSSHISLEMTDSVKWRSQEINNRSRNMHTMKRKRNNKKRKIFSMKSLLRSLLQPSSSQTSLKSSSSTSSSNSTVTLKSSQETKKEVLLETNDNDNSSDYETVSLNLSGQRLDVEGLHRILGDILNENSHNSHKKAKKNAIKQLYSLDLSSNRLKGGFISSEMNTSSNCDNTADRNITASDEVVMSRQMNIADVLFEQNLEFKQSLCHLKLNMNDLGDNDIKVLSAVLLTVQTSEEQKQIEELDNNHICKKHLQQFEGNEEILGRTVTLAIPAVIQRESSTCESSCDRCRRETVTTSSSCNNLSFPELRVLELGWNNIGPTGMDSLCQALESSVDSYHSYGQFDYPSSLEELDLSRNMIGDDGAISLARYILSTSSGHRSSRQVRKINLLGNKITAVGIKAIAQALTPTEATSSISKTNYHPTLSVLAAQCASQFSSEKFNSSTRLTELNLRFNQVDCEGAIALATMLQTNETLLHLDLSGSRIGMKGLLALHDCITQYNDTIQVLTLHGNTFHNTIGDNANHDDQHETVERLLDDIDKCIQANKDTTRESRTVPKKVDRIQKMNYNWLLNHWVYKK